MTAAAFFDVDETLISVKSMFDFLEFHLAACGEPPETYRRLISRVDAAKARGASRDTALREYFRLLAGQRADRLARSGEAWFADRLARGGLFIEPVLAELRTHRADGAAAVLLSGSFFACLDPVAEHVGAERTFGTRPTVRRGELTGEILAPMIGGAKARTAGLAATVRGWNLAECAAYGDHPSDLPLLEAVGHPVVVGADPVMSERAGRIGWRRIHVSTG